MGTTEVLPGDDRPETLHESARTRITRLFLDGRTVIRKQPLGPDAERRRRHEQAMLERLRGVEGVAQLEAAPQYPDSIVLSDAGGANLAEVLTPLPIDELIGVASVLAQAVAGMHRRGVMHRDITPDNVVISADGTPCLVDFARATALAELRPEFTHHAEITGTLAYLAPEQTGRTGRAEDQRADLYALGATLYELATGAPPFGSGDPLTLIHDHLAREPVPPAEVNPAIPAALSAVILHLLDKEPDNRYQTAEGLLHDLERVRNTPAGVLRVGGHDVPPRLLPPSRLAGRDEEVVALRAAFAESLLGRCQGVLVGGPPGVGKTALVDQLRPVVSGADGWFVAGKFDQYRRDLEFDAGYQAFRGLGRLLLAEPEDELAGVRERIVSALGPNVGLLSALVPEFAALLTTRADPGDPLTAQVRVQRVALQVLRAVASRKRPLVVFLDDLQWAARTPLGLLDLVLSEQPVEGLLVVGAYRVGDVDAAHPLAGVLSRWREEAGGRLLRLDNLPEPSLATMVAELLHVQYAVAADLARQIGPATSGNPYETVELLNALRDAGALTTTTEGWRWDDAAVRAHLSWSRAADGTAVRIRSVPQQSRQMIEAMACLGGRAETSLLQAATGEPANTVDQCLAPALDEGMLVAEPGIHEAIRFRHDRIREAVLRAMDPQRRRVLQLEMARQLAEVPELFAVAAEQYLPVADAVDDPAERRRVVELLRRAADQAALTGNHARVDALLSTALGLIEPGETATTIGVHTARHAALYSLGRLEEADEAYRTIEELCPAALERADATAVQVRSLTHRNRPVEGVGLAMRSLRELGIAVPSATQFPAEADRKLRLLYRWLDTDPAGDQIRPELSDPMLLAAARLFNAAEPAAYLAGDPALLAWVSLEALRIWVEQGPCAALLGATSHAALSALVLRGDYAAGYRALRRILAVGDARGYEPVTSQAHFLFALHCCWFEPLEHGVHEAQRAREGLLTGGDLANAAYTYNPTGYYLLDSAPTLDSFVAEVEAGLAFARRTGNEGAAHWLQPFRSLAGVLRGESSSAAEAVATDRDANLLALVSSHINRAVAAAIFDDPGGLDRHTTAAMPLMPVVLGLYSTAVTRLLRGLALAGQARAADGDERDTALAELDEQIGWLAERAVDAPDNFLHLVRLLEGERAWAVGNSWAAVLAFDAAQRGGRRRPWHRALIAERAAGFHLAHGLEHAGHALLAKARDQYAAWGATAKVAQLDWAHPSLRSGPDARHGAGAGQFGDPVPGRSAVTTGTLDLLGILSASQALSSETDLEKLPARVVEVLGALTGASAVHLLLWDDDGQDWLLPTVTGTMRVGLHETAVPLSVLRYVQRTGEPLAVVDAVRDDRFRRDPYLADVGQCSLLAVPISSGRALRAVLLLENRLIRGAFTGDRLDAVRLVAGQLTVSLNNVQLLAANRRVADEQAALRRVATLVAQGASPEAVFTAVVGEVGRLLAVDNAFLIRYEPEEALTVVGTWSRTRAAAPTPVGTRLPLGGRNVSTLVFQAGRPRRVDYDHASGSIGAVAAHDWRLRSSLGVPISVEGRLWGAMVVGLASEAALPEDAEARLAGFTELVATALANAEARVELRRHAREQEALRRVAVMVARGVPPEEVFATVTAEAGGLLDADHTSLIRYDPDGCGLVVAVWNSGGVAGPVSTGTRIPLGGRNVTSLVFESGRPARMDDFADASGSAAALALGWEIRTGVGVPVAVEGRLWGVLSAVSTSELLPVDAEDRLRSFTELVATALANGQARMELRRHAEEQAALRRVATLVARGVPPEEVFAAVAEEVGRLLGAGFTILSRCEAEGMQISVGAWSRTGDSTPFPVGTRVRLGGRNVVSLVVDSGRPARIDDYLESSGEVADAARGYGLGSAVGAPVTVGGRLWGVMAVASGRAQSMPSDVEARLAGFTELVGTALANAQARVELRGFAEEQAALRRVATLVARAAPPEELFMAVAAEAGRLLGADLTSVGRFETDESMTILGEWSRAGPALPFPIGTRVPLGGRNPPSMVLRTGRPARLDDRADADAGTVRDLGARSSLAVPIIVAGRLWGVVSLAYMGEKPRSPFEAEAQLVGFAELIATAIANAEARSSLTASRSRVVAASDETRRRLERDLHDGIQQGLLSLILQAAAAGELGDHQAAEMRAELVELRGGLVAALDELRETARGIHPSILTEAGLRAALGSLARRCAVPVVLDFRAEQRLPEPVEVAAYYVVSEALTNAVKHARATQIEVTVTPRDEMLHVRVRDDGRGGADPTGGSGLVGLTDRAEALGGRLSVYSPPGTGTTVEVVLPLPAAGPI